MFEEMINELKKQVRATVLDTVKDFLKKENKYELLLTRKEAAEIIGISPSTFDETYRYRLDFPKVMIKSDERYPRDQVVEYFSHIS